MIRLTTTFERTVIATAAVAREAGLAEWLCEALGRVARLATAAEADAACAEAQVLAHSQGFGWLIVQLDGEIPRPRRRA